MSECRLYLAVSEKHVQIAGATSHCFYLGLRVTYTVLCHIYVSVPQLSRVYAGDLRLYVDKLVGSGVPVSSADYKRVCGSQVLD